MVKTEQNVSGLAEQLDVWPQIRAAIPLLVGENGAEQLWHKIANLPIQRSRATRILGSYVFRAETPLCIRLQFDQEPEMLKETFLHELAHACDHLTWQSNENYRRAHGPSWKRWARALGIEGQVRGSSEALGKLYRERLKPVAVCHKCGAVVQRLRRLNRRHKYFHRNCGGRIKPL